MAQRGSREVVSTGSGTGDAAGLSERVAGSGEEDTEGDFLNTLLYSLSSSVSPFSVWAACEKLSAVLLRDSLHESDGRRCTPRGGTGDDGTPVGDRAELEAAALLAAGTESLDCSLPSVVGVMDGCVALLLLCLKETFT